MFHVEKLGHHVTCPDAPWTGSLEQTFFSTFLEIHLLVNQQCAPLKLDRFHL